MGLGEEYILEWLDLTVNFSLNPAKNQMEQMSASQLRDIQQRAFHTLTQLRIRLTLKRI